jgi:type I restriction enzyme S subunit
MFYKETVFQETVIGSIPKDWTVEYVSELFQVETGTTPSTTKKKDYWEKGTENWLTPTDMSKSNGRIHISSSERRITSKAIEECNLTVLPKGSLILSTRAPVGYVAVLSEESAFNQGCKGLIPRESANVCSEFYYYYLLSKKQILNNLSSGSTFKELSKEMLEKVRVVFLKPREQEEIVEVLSCVDLAIQKTSEVVAKTERLKKGLMQKLLTEGIGHGEFKDTEIGRIPTTWKTTRFGDLATRVQNGLYKEKRYYGSGYALVRMKEFFRNAELTISDDILNVQANKDELTRFSLKEEDLLFARTSLKAEGSGKCVIVPKLIKPVLFESNIIRISLNTAVAFPKFYFYWLNSSIGRRFVSRVIRTVAASIVTGNDLKRVRVPLPPELREQQEITKILSAVDDKIAIENEEKTKLKRIKMGLMDLLLSGKVRVRMD